MDSFLPLLLAFTRRVIFEKNFSDCMATYVPPYRKSQGTLIIKSTLLMLLDSFRFILCTEISLIYTRVLVRIFLIISAISHAVLTLFLTISLQLIQPTETSNKNSLQCSLIGPGRRSSWLPTMRLSCLALSHFTLFFHTMALALHRLSQTPIIYFSKSYSASSSNTLVIGGFLDFRCAWVLKRKIFSTET